jgi:hypothetical protein
MVKNNKAGNEWINSVLIQQNLVEPKEEQFVDLKPCWARVEECRMVERIGKIAADINEAAGYYVLELHDFLPPQATILSVKYSKRFSEYMLEIMAGEDGAATVAFYSLSKISALWELSFRNQPRRKPTMFLEFDFHPFEIQDADLRRWFSYLLSGFEKKLKPSAPQQMSEKENAELSRAFRQKSA